MYLPEFTKYMKDNYGISDTGLNFRDFMAKIKFAKAEDSYTHREAYLYIETHKDLVNFYLL